MRSRFERLTVLFVSEIVKLMREHLRIWLYLEERLRVGVAVEKDKRTFRARPSVDLAGCVCRTATITKTGWLHRRCA
jgi:hypothetical protein